MRKELCKLLVLACCLSSLTTFAELTSWAESTPSLPLHNLNAGTKLVAKQPIVIPANANQITLSSGAVPGSICKLRVKEAKPFDRVLPEDHALTVSGTSRSGFSSSRRLSLSTYVRFDSHAVDDLVCVADRGSHEMTLNEFSKVLAGEFAIQPSNHPATIID
jgi:hypothetical protein